MAFGDVEGVTWGCLGGHWGTERGCMGTQRGDVWGHKERGCMGTQGGDVWGHRGDTPMLHLWHVGR